MNDDPTYERKQRVYYQLGAPSLIYYQRNDDAKSVLPPHRYPEVHALTIHERFQRCNRAKTRWNYSVDLDLDSDIAMPKEVLKKGYRRKWKGPKKLNDLLLDNHGESDKARRSIRSVQHGRLAMLLEGDARVGNHRDLLENYSIYDYPYFPGLLEHMKHRKSAPELRLGLQTFRASRNFSLDHRISSDPSYLAPFGAESLKVCEDPDERAIPLLSVDRSKIAYPKRRQQGNCLLVFSCPCSPCRNRPSDQRSMCLVHPKGALLDRICVSNLMPTNGVENAGHVLKLQTWQDLPQIKQIAQSVIKQLPNELSLDDTILEIKQAGTWNGDMPESIFVVRTGTHISVLNITARKPYLQEQKYAYEKDVCWGNYVMEERQRIDLRSLRRSFPSYRPVSLACHPKYGNALTNAQFAFVSHSDRDEFNVIHHGTAGSEPPVTKHAISNLKHISLIDFSSTQPMCLWSAATSYVRPALAPDVQYNQPIFGLGSSLYSVDLRTDSATFQWSPSAEEMVTEGVHSISGIMTDWQHDNTLWVTSTSAGKTWEIDSRMPCRSVTSWSLSSSCEDSASTFPQKGLFGEGSLLTTTWQTKSSTEFDGFAVVNIDTTPGAFGFHVYQRPENRPRFQTDSVECVATAGLDFTNKASVATSSVFALPELSDEVYVCGISCLRCPLSHFVDEDKSYLPPFGQEDADVLCTLTLTNTGDILCHPLLASKEGIRGLRHPPDLPVGSKVVTIPRELDGKTKELEHNHWKPTGGMNLKLFLTNQYPTAWGAIKVPEKSSGASTIPVSKWKRKKTHPSLATDPDVPLLQFNSQKSGIALTPEPTVNEPSQDETLVLSRPLAEKSRKPMIFDDGEQNDDEMVDLGERRSDLTAVILQQSSHMWDELDSQSEDLDLV